MACVIRRLFYGRSFFVEALLVIDQAVVMVSGVVVAFVDELNVEGAVEIEGDRRSSIRKGAFLKWTQSLWSECAFKGARDSRIGCGDDVCVLFSAVDVDVTHTSELVATEVFLNWVLKIQKIKYLFRHHVVFMTSVEEEVDFMEANRKCLKLKYVLLWQEQMCHLSRFGC